MDTQSNVEAVLATQRQGSLLDTRWVKPGVSTSARCYTRSGNTAAALGSIISHIRVPTSEEREIVVARWAVISPGFAIVAQNQDDAAVTRYTAVWRERPTIPGEA